MSVASVNHTDLFGDNYSVAKTTVGGANIYLEIFSGDYSIIKEETGGDFSEVELGRVTKEAAMASYKKVVLKATLKITIAAMMAAMLKKQPAPPAPPASKVVVTTTTRKVGFPETEKIGARPMVVKHADGEIKTQMVGGKTTKVLNDDGSQKWAFTRKQKGIISCEGGNYRVVFSCQWMPYHFVNDDWDECVGKRLEWSCTQLKLHIPVKQEFRGGEFFDVLLDPIWVKGASQRTTALHMAEELTRMTGKSEDQVLALINEASVGG